MPHKDILLDIVISACLGALVGLIRQWSDQVRTEKPMDFGGVRTYTFWSILGCLGANGAERLGPSLFLVILLLVGAHQIVSMAKVETSTPPGGTTFASVLLTVLAGALVAWEQRQAALLITATTMVILGIKQTIHAWTRAFTTQDIRGTLQFVAITGVILPLVPDKAYGPFAAFNPYSTWLMVVFISGLGFAGYIAMRMLGAQAGITVTGIAGGIASSTATTLAFSRRSKEDPALSTDYALAVVLACTVMLARILVVVGVVNRDLALSVLPCFALMSLPGVAAIILRVLFRRSEAQDVATPTLHNPLSLGMAVKFALIYAAIAFLVRAVTQLDLHSGMLPLSFISGLTDMDAIALLMANSANDASVAPRLAAQAVVIAGVGNSLMKGGLAVAFGSPLLRLRVALVLGTTAAVGIASLWLL
jgi:uncharacterized membrane protein (DUF4010 family)